MEIKQVHIPLTPARADTVADTGQVAKSTLAPQDASLNDAADDTQAALVDAARNLHDAQATRYQAHKQVTDEINRSLGAKERDGALDSGKLDALRDALAGAVLSDKIDGAREREAGATFLTLLRGAGNDEESTPQSTSDSGNDGVDDGEQDQPSVSPRSMPVPYSAANGADSKSGNNLGDIWKELAEMIGKSKDGDLAEFAAALEKYTALYQAIADILAKFGQWVRGDDDNYMRVDFASLKQALTDLLNKYANPTQDQVIAGKAPSGGLTEDEAKAVCEKLGLDPKECCHQNDDGTYCVVPDMSQVKNMLSGLPSSSNDYKISIASYNAWKAGFDSQMSRVEDALQTRGQKYSNTYSRFENFHKTISSIIQTMADMLRQFLQF